jgi:uncharacterized membrane protein
MTLPDISIYIPKVVLPFDIPTLLHPITVHFMVAIPVIVLLLELINLFAKKKAIGVISFVLLFLTMFAAVGAYFTGLVDGKEGFELLTQSGKDELAEHKLLGIYLLLASAVVLLFKLLSAAISSGFVKILYLLLLIGFILGIFQQGKDGGELVYEHGMNVERVKALDDRVFELEEALEEAQEKMTEKDKETEESLVTPEVLPEVQKESTPEVVTPVETTVAELKTEQKQVVEVPEPQVEEVVESLKTVEKETPSEVLEVLPAESLKTVQPVKSPVEAEPQPVLEEKSEVKEVLPFPEPVEVEAMPKAVEQVQIPTH